MSKPETQLKKPPFILPPIKNNSAQDCVDSRLRAGYCVTLAKCPYMIEEFYDEARKTSYGINFQTYVSNSLCGFDGINFLICCGKRFMYPIAVTKPSISIQSTPASYVTTMKPYEQLAQTTVFHFSPLSSNTLSPIMYTTSTKPAVASTTSTPDMGVIVFRPTPPNGGVQIIQSTPGPTAATGDLISQTVQTPLATSSTPQAFSCGVSRGTTNRVVGGNEAKKGNYPWMAALGYRNEYDAKTLQFLCAGSLISSKYVITSAHCINGYLMLVRLGAHDLSNAMEADARNYGIKRIVTHDMFDLKTIANDLALIELSETVVMTRFIVPICLPDDSKFLTEEFVGMNPFVAGWGATKHQGPTSNVLREVQVPIISRQACEQSYRTVFNFVKFSDKLICAGNSNVDACQGDSGGPLMLPQMIDNSYHYYLIGVVSFGYECARTGFPGVYSRVAAYMPWIKSNMV
ncbi:hypothetical protein DOY81_003400 [Sarcophaga bullata]|nr:hypothetical protein DOY81_003400 [Sarcophaga bullata]